MDDDYDKFVKSNRSYTFTIGTPAFDAMSTPSLFAGASTPAFGAMSTPAFGAATS